MKRVRAVIIKDDQVLTIERYKNDEHFWCFPGGGVEEGESDIDALKREVLEETNIKVGIKEKIFEQDFRGDKINFYLCDFIFGEAEKGDGPEYQENKNYIGSHNPVWLEIKKLKNFDLRPIELREKIRELS